MDFLKAFEAGHSYDGFLEKYGSDVDRQKWADMHARVSLTDGQRELLASFRRELKVLCFAGAWCGDCVDQCPILDHIAAASSVIEVRYVDRDADEGLKEAMMICGGARVPGVIFMNEDGQKLGQYGDRTLAKYRSMTASLEGAGCSTGLGDADPLLQAVTQEWLDQFERVHSMALLSPRLRAKHGD